MTGYIRVHCGTQSHLQNIGRSGSFKGYICGFQQQSLKSDGDTSNWWAIGWGQSGCRCEYGVAMESKVRVGSEMETAGVTEKLEVTVGSEVETEGGTAIGVDTDV